MSDVMNEPVTPDLLREMEALIVRRVEDIERDNQRLRRLLTIVSAGLGVALLASLAFLLLGRGSVTDSVEARQFVLRDQQGTARAVMQMMENGSSGLILQDRDGRERLRLSVLPDGSPGLTLADQYGRSRAVLGLLRDQTVSLALADASGKTRAVLGVPADGSSTLVLADRAGDTRAAVGVDAGGQPSVTLFEDAPAASPVQPLTPLDSVAPQPVQEPDIPAAPTQP